MLYLRDIIMRKLCDLRCWCEMRTCRLKSNELEPTETETKFGSLNEPSGTMEAKLFWFSFLSTYLIHSISSEDGIPVERGLNWYETLPAVAMDYKVHVDAGKEDCYWQYVAAGATFYVSMQVIRGGDGMAGFAVRHPSGHMVHPYQWQANSDYTDGQSLGGYYSVCIDNQFSRFASKLVNLYITVVKYDDWEKFTKEIEDLNVNMQNFTTVVQTVESNLNLMHQFQAHSRARESRDYALIKDNESYVGTWSLVQIFVIVITTCVQVYFVRKLFDIKSSGYQRSRI